MNIIYHKGFPFLLLSFLFTCGVSFAYINLGLKTFFFRGYFRTFLGLAFIGLLHFEIWGSVLWFMTSSKPFPLIYSAIGTVLLFILSLLDPWLTPNACEDESLEILHYHWKMVVNSVPVVVVFSILIFIMNYVGEQLAIEDKKKDLRCAQLLEEIDQNTKKLRESDELAKIWSQRVAKTRRETTEAKARLEEMRKKISELTEECVQRGV